MKDQLKNSMKPTSEQFRSAVQRSIDAAVAQSAPEKKRLSKGWRIAIAVAVLAALIPSAVFGASKLYEILARPVDNYGLELDIQRETNADYPKYVKMHVDIPEGFAVVPNTDDLKYCKTDSEDPFNSGFSLVPMRYENADQTAYIANVSSYEECIVSGHRAYSVTVSNIKGTWNQLYVFFEDVNVMLLIYHKDVIDEQLSDFVAGISFTEGTASDCITLNEPYDERQNAEVTCKFDVTYIEKTRDTKLTFKGYSQINKDESLCYTAQISDIRITDSIEGLDENCFLEAYPPNEIADANGKLTSKEFFTFREGDGFQSTYEELSRGQKEQKMILAEIEYENLSDEDIALYIPYHLAVLNQDDKNNYISADVIDEHDRIYSTPCCDTELTYLSPHGEGKSFYIPILKANETMTVTIGIRCNADMLDKAYIGIDGVSDIVDPVFEGNGDYTTYLFKVSSNDR